MSKTDGLTLSEVTRIVDTSQNCFVVGIGASAGGLEALEIFFDGIPDDSSMAFVVVQHLAPDFKSMMDDILRRITNIRVRMIENDMQIEPNTIYLLPPNQEVICSGRKLLLTERSSGRELSFPIDQFFRSLADDVRHRSVAIILSGTGTDGSRGICRVHEQGGFVISQEVDSAKFDGMPRAAVETGIVDLIAPAGEIPKLLMKFIQDPTNRRELTPMKENASMEGPIYTIFHLLKKQSGVDFSDYKTTTIGRRIHRRVMLAGQSDLESYTNILKENPEEVERLYKDLLIGVTCFFRDRDVFDLLEQEIIPGLFESLGDDQEFRVWVVGTATGEEAYSLAILISEYMERNNRVRPVKIFATDVHNGSLETASRAVYDEPSINGVSTERLKRFFIKKTDGYHIVSELRNMVVCHNMVRDAPFTKIDLITCRNVLIYLNAQAQNKALSLFHFALNREGILCLGPSETLGELSSEFTVLNDRTRIYKKHRDALLPAASRLPVNIPRLDSIGVNSKRSEMVPSAKQSVQELITIYDRLLLDYMPPGLLIDTNGDLLHVFEGSEKFIQKFVGRVSTDIYDVIHPDLRSALVSGIRRARDNKKPVSYQGVACTIKDKKYQVTLIIRPYHIDQNEKELFLIQFQTESELSPSQDMEVMRAGSVSREEVLQLELELQHTRDNLQAIIEQSQTTNEELQSTNEQLIASNEELQSTNEELHSVNEELYTVNAEHQRKIEELTELTNDMDNLLATTNVHTIFLDNDLRIRRFTPGIAETFNLITHDVGRRIDSFTYSIIDEELVQEIKQVILKEEPFEREVRDRKDSWYLMRILPYWSDGKVDGIVLTLIDITSLKLAERKLAEVSEIVEHSDDAILRLSNDGIVTTWNAGAEKLFGFSRDEITGQPITLIVPENFQREAQVILQQAINGTSVDRFETQRICKDGTVIDVSLTLSPIRNDSGKVVGASEIIRDVTARKLAEKEVQNAVRNRDRFLAMLSHELRNPMAAVLNATSLLHEDGVDEETELEAYSIIERNVRHVARLLDDLLDLSRFTHDKISLHRQVIDLNELVMDIVDCVQPIIDEKGHQFHVQRDSLPVFIEGDSGRIQQAQVNLLVNAAKYTSSEGRIDYSLRREQNRAVIRVRDNGIGIEESLLSDIFKPFVQSEQALDRSQGGMGLGLPLVKMIIEAHGGSIKAYSNGAGEGSEFVVHLPITELRPENKKGLDIQVLAGKKMVIVEDNPGIRKMLAASMKLKGLTVFTATDGTQGLESVLENDPDIALIDIGLPDMNGYEVARLIRARSDRSNLLLVAVTGYGRESDRKQTMKAGFNLHLVKPLDPGELLSAISDFYATSKSL
ncbi:MAG: chemotaxis protein CheB [Planctomycetaceae bacterium]